MNAACRRVFGHVDERVHRAFKISRAVGELLPGYVHRHDGIEVNIGIHGNGVRLLFGDGALRLCGERKRRANEKAKDQGCRALFQVTLLLHQCMSASVGFHPNTRLVRVYANPPLPERPMALEPIVYCTARVP
jgi:hypothetical protein